MVGYMYVDVRCSAARYVCNRGCVERHRKFSESSQCFFLLVYLYDYGQYLVTFCSTGSVLNHGHKTIVKKMKVRVARDTRDT